MNERQRQDLQRMRKLLDDPRSDPVEIADCYVLLLSEQLLTLARQGYARSGRGAVEIDLRGIDLRNATGGLPIHYFPTDDIMLEDWPDGTDEILDTYDATREVVVLLIQDGGSLIYILE